MGRMTPLDTAGSLNATRIAHPSPPDPWRVVDLFAGIGGIRQGFTLAGGYTTVLAAENDRFCRETYTHLYGHDPDGDVSTPEFHEKINNTPYDVLCGGFPCQTFSRAGKQAGFLDDTKGTLFFHVAHIIKTTRPTAVLLENVDNLLRHDKGRTWRTVVNILTAELGYSIVGVPEKFLTHPTTTPVDVLRNSRHFGVPQNRPRIYILAVDTTTHPQLATTIHTATLPRERSANLPPIYPHLNDVLDTNVPSRYYLSEGMWTYLQQHKKLHATKGHGFGYIILNDPDNPRTYSNTILATGGSGKERNLIKNMNHPIPDTPREPSRGRRTPMNRDGIRYLTPTECGKLQGFVGYGFMTAAGHDTFSFPPHLSMTQQYKQFGNAVTIPVAQEMGTLLTSLLAPLHTTP